MEVASPLTFNHSAGTKRHLPCSSGLMDASASSRSPFTMGMEATEEYGNPRSFKRRRFNVDDRMDSESENTPSHFPSLPLSSTPGKSVFSPSNGQCLKRCRTEAFSPQQDMQRVVLKQAEEIETLKADKAHIESSLNRLRGDHEKVVNENRILKRAVTIQQERQNQATNELGAARRFKLDAEERIKKLEQLILSLRYHLQAQPSNPGNDFMGFPPRPPDVF